jgi:hypothetical protein
MTNGPFEITNAGANISDAWWGRVQAIAERLNVEPLNGRSYPGIAIYGPDGSSGYALDMIVGALLDRLDAAVPA